MQQRAVFGQATTALQRAYGGVTDHIRPWLQQLGVQHDDQVLFLQQLTGRWITGLHRFWGERCTAAQEELSDEERESTRQQIWQARDRRRARYIPLLHD